MEAKEFFPNVRRELEIMDYHVLKSSGGERRVKANLRVPIAGGRPVSGMPEWTLEARESVIKDRGIHRKVVCELEIEGVTVEFFNSPEVKRRTLLINGSTLKQFSIERVGKDNKADVFLNMVLYAPASKEIADWFYEHLHGYCYAEFDATQAAFSYDGEDQPKEDSQLELPTGDQAPAETDASKPPAKKSAKKKK
jgi:hypothetical protein